MSENKKHRERGEREIYRQMEKNENQSAHAYTLSPHVFVQVSTHFFCVFDTDTHFPGLLDTHDTPLHVTSIRFPQRLCDTQKHTLTHTHTHTHAYVCVHLLLPTHPLR